MEGAAEALVLLWALAEAQVRAQTAERVAGPSPGGSGTLVHRACPHSSESRVALQPCRAQPQVRARVQERTAIGLLGVILRDRGGGPRAVTASGGPALRSHPD